MNDSDIKEYYFEILPVIFSFLNNLSVLSIVLLPERVGRGRRHIVSWKRRQLELWKKKSLLSFESQIWLSKIHGETSVLKYSSQVRKKDALISSSSKVWTLVQSQSLMNLSSCECTAETMRLWHGKVLAKLSMKWPACCWGVEQKESDFLHPLPRSEFWTRTHQ